jgi:hypothetical protein
VSRLVCFAALVACSVVEPRTEVLVTVDAGAEIRRMTDTLRVVVRGGPAGALEDRADQSLGTAPIVWPVAVAVVPLGGDEMRVFEVEATAANGSSVVGRVRAVSTFVAGRTLELRLVLEDCCRAVTCGASDTCRECACTSAYVDPLTLPALDGSMAEVDARSQGPDGETDAATARDADSHEGGAIDAGVASDGGPACTLGPGGHCYNRISDPLTWLEAESACVALGGHLVAIETAPEQDVAWSVSMGGGWIGATDEGSEGAWRWTTGESWTPRWGSTQPDNAGGAENCAALWSAFDGAWADVSCDSRLPAVCELP